MAIHADVARGATLISQAAATAEQHGQLASALPDAVVLLSLGMLLCLRDLQMHLIDRELS
jgi:hypothetical protein